MSTPKRPRSDSSYQTAPQKRTKSRKLPEVPLPEDAFTLANAEPMSDAEVSLLSIGQSSLQPNPKKFRRLVDSNYVWTSKAVKSMDVFQTSYSLEEISNRSKVPSYKLFKKVKELENQEPQILSGRWVDKKKQTLAVYFSFSKDPLPEPEPKGVEEGGGRVDQNRRQRNKQVSCVLCLITKLFAHPCILPKPVKEKRSRVRKRRRNSQKHLVPQGDPMPLSKQYQGRTISTLPWDINSRRWYGLSVGTPFFSLLSYPTEKHPRQKT